MGSFIHKLILGMLDEDGLHLRVDRALRNKSGQKYERCCHQTRKGIKRLALITTAEAFLNRSAD